MRLWSSVVFGALVASGCLLVAQNRLPALNADRWVNSPPLNTDVLRGKVVLVDFWEYTCINWIRTVPYIQAWHRDYAALGLVVVGVHSPEFEFSKRAENVDRGIRDHALAYPIAIDNRFSIWRAFGNDAWPAKYLYDRQGRLIRHWAGEGRYDEIESAIRAALVAGSPGTQLPPVSREAAGFAVTGQLSYAGITHETYVGSARRPLGGASFKGEWRTGPEFVELRKGLGTITMPFTAGEVNLVVQPGPTGNATMTVMLDGVPVGDARGADVGADGVARLDHSGMIRMVSGAARGRHVLTLTTSDAGVRVYAFTFGP